jgi:LPS-assembly protein
VWSEIDLTGFAFLDRPRSYSPVTSALRMQTKVNIEWRTDYDPLRHQIVNNTVSVDGRINKYFWGVGHALVRTDPVLMPNADQIQLLFGYGNPNNRGWNYGFHFNYDFKQQVLQYWQAQVTYNTDCCGFSALYRRWSIGTRDDTQFEVAFSVSNIGTAGNMKKQDRLF